MSVDVKQIKDRLVQAISAHIGDVDDVSKQELDSIIYDFKDDLEELKRSARDEDDEDDEDDVEDEDEDEDEDNDIEGTE